MNCKSVQRRLTEDLKVARQDGLLLEHLRSCPQCQALCEELVSLQKLSRELRHSVPAPARFPSALWAERLAEPSWQRRWKPAFALVVVAVLALGILWISGSGGVFPSSQAGQQIQSLQEFRTLPAEAEGLAAPYVEILLNQSSEQDHVLRLPPTIEIRRTELHHDFDLRHVSH